MDEKQKQIGKRHGGIESCKVISFVYKRVKFDKNVKIIEGR